LRSQNIGKGRLYERDASFAWTMVSWLRRKKPPPPDPPFTVGCLFASSDHGSHASHGDFVQADVLQRGPDNREATGLRREDADLISPLPHIALRDFQWRWWSECADACLAGTRKR
jgi:hypothetical protein